MAYKFEYSYHNHTIRCHHAKNTEEEMIVQAIKSGLKGIGISEHVGVKGSNGTRIDYEDMDDFILSMKHLKQKYQDQIEVYCAFECEYELEQLDSYYQLINNPDVDYLILGQHFARANDNDYYYARLKDDSYLEKYTNDIIKGMETGLFSMVAHPDLVFAPFKEFKDKYIEASYMICQKAKQLNLPLEINAYGLRKQASQKDPLKPIFYPKHEFFEIARTVGNEIVISSDAHSISHVYDKFVEAAIDFGKNQKLINQINFIKNKY